MVNNKSIFLKNFKIVLIIYLVIISLIFGFIKLLNYLENHQIHKEEKKSVGTYFLDLSASTLPEDVQFNKEDSLIFQSLTLNLNSNNTFKFSRKFKNLYDSIGVWKLIIDEPNRYINYYEFNSKLFFMQGSRCCFDSNRIDLNYGLGSFLIFIKMK